MSRGKGGGRFGKRKKIIKNKIKRGEPSEGNVPSIYISLHSSKQQFIFPFYRIFIHINTAKQIHTIERIKVALPLLACTSFSAILESVNLNIQSPVFNI